MGSIETTIIVDVEGIGSVEALAAAANDLDAAWDRLEGSLAKGLDVGGSAAGFDKMAASADAAFAKMQADADKFMESMSKLGDMGSVGDAGAASLGKLDDSLKAASEQADTLAASVGKADDTLKGLGGSADASAAGLGKLSDAQKSVAETGAGLRDTSAGVSDGLKVQADQTAALTALQADMADSQKALTALSAEHAAVMADSNAKIAAGQRLNSAAYKVASEDAVAAQKTQSAAAAQSAADAEAGAKKYHMLALGGAAALAYGVDLAAKLQTSVTRLYTTAGESQANLPMMTAGILALSGQTNTSQAQLGQGAYMVESAGYHGKDALGVLKAAAQGAQAEGAPLGDTANALTSLMNAYGVPKGTTAPKAAMSDMDQIIAMVSRGKMTMAGAVGALPDVLPAASAAHLSFADVGGALATMTSLGVSPDRGAQNLSHVITSLMNPSAVQTKEQQQLGLNPVQLQNDLGKQGLTGTLTELSSTVMHSMGPAGDVLFKTFNQSRSAAADAQTMINAMPPAIRGVAQAYADGKTTVAQWNAEMFKGSESSVQKNMLQQFATTENQAKGFNELLKTGAPDVQTYAAAMDKLLGGQTGLNVAMELTGQHMPVMKANTDAIAASAQHAGANVSGWSQVQGTLNFQLGSFTKTLQAVATEAGQVALPAITDTLKAASAAGSFLADHPALTKDLAIGGGILGAMAIAPKLASVGATALSSVGKVAETLNIPGLDKLANIGQGTGMAGAAASLSGAGASLDGAAASLEGAAASLKAGAAGGAVGAGEASAAGAAGEGATVGEGAAAGGAAAAGEGAAAGIGIKATAAAVLQGVAIGAAIDYAAGHVASHFMAKPTPKMEKQYEQQTPGWLQDAANAMFGKPGAASLREGYGHAARTAVSNWGADIFGGHGGDRPPGIMGPVAPGTQFHQAGALPEAWHAATSAVNTFFYGNTGNTRVDSTFGGGRAGALGVPPPAAAAGPAPSNAPGILDMLGGAGHPGTATAKIGVTVDTSSISAAKGKIAADLAALSTSQGMKPAKVPAPDLSALASAKGPATAAGASVGTGFASGIAAGAGAVSAAAHSLAAAAVAALTMHLQSSSPSKVTHAIGQDGFDAGFAGGISDGQGAAIAATAALGTSSVSTLVQSLEGGSTSLQNALTALYGPLADSQAVTTIAQEIAALQASHPADSKWLGKQGAKLEQLANQAGALEQQISGAQQVATSVIGGASVMSASGYTAAVPTAGGPQSAQSILSGTALQVSDTKQFAKELAQAQKEGLNATTLSEIAQAGVTAGLPVLQGLLQGGPGTVKQMNALESQLIKAGGQIGNVGGPAGYQATLAADAAAGAQLKSELSMVGKEMSKVANEVSRATGGTKSTSATSAGTTSTGAAAASVTALASGGKSAAGSLDAVNGAAHGAAGGLNSVDAAAHAAASALAALAGAAGGSSSASGSGSGASAGTGTGLMPRTGGGGGGAQAQGGGFTPGFHGISGYGQAPVIHQTTHVHLNVQGSVMSDQDLASHVQRVLLNHGSNNWQAGMNYPGRSN